VSKQHERPEQSNLRKTEATSTNMTFIDHRLRVASFVSALALACFTVGWLREAKHSTASPAQPRLQSVASSERQPGFPCGSLVCDRTSYCETINTDVPALPSNYACRPLPSACLPQASSSTLDCQCFPPRTRGDFCSAPIVGGSQVFYRTTIGGH
jgi:hypothetical protein